MINKLIFYNNQNNGDIHFTREFVKDIIKKTSYDEYYFLHLRSPKLLMDVPNLKHDIINSNCLRESHYHIINNETYINTHLFGLYPGSELTKSVNIDVFYDYFQTIYHKLKIPMEVKKFYVPTIDYNAYEIAGVNEYIQNNKSFNKIIISNGDVFSSQSMPIDFKTLIEKLATEFTDTHFILTDKKDVIELPNVLYTADIIKSIWDLNEISYLSTFCSIIIGRASGPYSFMEVKQNLNNEDKTFIFICNIFTDGMWHEQNLCTKVWINNYDFDNVYETIHKEIEKKNNYYNLFDVSSAGNRIMITPFIDMPQKIRIDFYQGKDLLYKYSANFTMGMYHWVMPHGHYQTGTEIKCKFYIDETNEYLFQKWV